MEDEISTNTPHRVIQQVRQTTYTIAGFFHLNYLCVEVYLFQIVWLNIHDRSQDIMFTYSSKTHRSERKRDHENHIYSDQGGDGLE